MGSATTEIPAAATASATSRWRASVCSPSDTQWLAVTPCGNCRADHQLGEVGQAQHRRVEGLVGVQIDADAVVGGDRQEHLGGRPRVAVVLEMGTSPDQVGTGGQRVDQQRTLVGPARSRHRPATQRDDLHIDDVGDPVAQRHQRLDAGQSVVEGGVGVGSHEPEPVGGHHPGRPLGPGQGLVRAEPVADGLHRPDRPHQVAGLVGHDVGQEGLVEMGMGFDRRRREDEARQIDGRSIPRAAGLAPAGCTAAISPAERVTSTTRPSSRVAPTRTVVGAGLVIGCTLRVGGTVRPCLI